MKTNYGFTLIELLTTVSIFSLLLSLAIPEFQSMAQHNQITSAYNAFLSTIQFTRSEAIKRGNNVIICKWDNLEAACVSSRNWQDGWAVFDDKNDNGSKDTNEDIIRIHKSLPSSIQMDYRKTKLNYNSEGFSPGYAGTITFCSTNTEITNKGLKISFVGHVRVAEQDELGSCTNG